MIIFLISGLGNSCFCPLHYLNRLSLVK